jgi:hypothetical protein
MLNDLPATLDGQQLGPRLVVDILGIAQAREVSAEHPQDRRTVLGVVALDLGVAAERWESVKGMSTDSTSLLPSLSTSSLNTPHPNLVAKVYRKPQELNPSAPF